jgi:hypothetical protein
MSMIAEHVDDDAADPAHTLAEVDRVGALVCSIMDQLVARGVDPAHIAVALLGLGAKTLRHELGPDDAAAVVHAMADEVEADRGRFDA